MDSTAFTSTLSGRLGSISLQDILGFLSTLQVCGGLTVCAPEGETTLYLDAGGIVGATVDGRVDDDPAELFERVCRALTRASESFRFEEGRRPPHDAAIEINVPNLLLESARRLDEWNRLPAFYADPESRFEMVADPKSDEKVSMDLEEWRVLYLVTSCRTLEEIWQRSPLDSHLETSRTLYGLAAARLIEPQGLTATQITALPPASAEEKDGLAESPVQDLSLSDLSYTGAITPPQESSAETPAKASPMLSTADVGRLAAGETGGAAFGTLEMPPLVLADRSSASIEPPEGRFAVPPTVPASVLLPPGVKRLTRAQIEVQRTGRLIMTAPQEETFSLGEDSSIGLGRSPANNIVLNDGHVSGRHACLRQDGDHFVLEDLDSANGVFVDGRRTPRSFLRGGEEIEIYPYRFRFELEFVVLEDPS